MTDTAETLSRRRQRGAGRLIATGAAAAIVSLLVSQFYVPDPTLPDARYAMAYADTTQTWAWTAAVADVLLAAGFGLLVLALHNPENKFGYLVKWSLVALGSGLNAAFEVFTATQVRGIAATFTTNPSALIDYEKNLTFLNGFFYGIALIGLILIFYRQNAQESPVLPRGANFIAIAVAILELAITISYAFDARPPATFGYTSYALFTFVLLFGAKLGWPDVPFANLWHVGTPAGRTVLVITCLFSVIAVIAWIVSSLPPSSPTSTGSAPQTSAVRRVPYYGGAVAVWWMWRLFSKKGK